MHGEKEWKNVTEIISDHWLKTVYSWCITLNRWFSNCEFIKETQRWTVIIFCDIVWTEKMYSLICVQFVKF